MKILPILITIFLTFFFQVHVCFAQNDQTTNDTVAEKETIKETDTKANDHQLDLDVDVSDVLAIDENLEKFDDYYKKLIKSLGLTEGSLGSLIGSLALILIFFISKKILSLILNKLRTFILRFKVKYKLSFSRIQFYHKCMNIILNLILACLSLLSIMNLWDFDLSWMTSDSIKSMTGSLVSLFLVTALGIFVVEITSGLLERYFDQQKLSEARISTIKPIAKNIILGFIFFLFGMVALSQLGIDILPLLAGAGVLGIAVGFGAQALVKDIITGFIIILEDLIQVGDIVTLNEKWGTIERITIRKVQMRNVDGTVYTIPFGEISIVENHTKIFSYYLLKIGVAYRENIDEVISILKETGETLKRDENFAQLMLEDLEILGLDEFADSAVIIKARLKTLPGKQWVLGREFNRRMKVAFDKNNIEIPFPHQTIYIGEDKAGNSPALNIQGVENIKSAELNQ